MLPPLSAPSAHALSGEGLRGANICGASHLAVGRASHKRAPAASFSTAGRASARVRAAAADGSGTGDRSEGRKLSGAERRWAEAEARRAEGERWGGEKQLQRQGEWWRAEGRKADSKGSWQRDAGYADDVAAEDRLREERGGAVDWLMRPSNEDVDAELVRSGEWNEREGGGRGGADRGWIGDGNAERLRRDGTGRGRGDGAGRGRGDGGMERGRRTVEDDGLWSGRDRDVRGSMGAGTGGGDMSLRPQQQQTQQLPQSSPPQQRLQLQRLSSPSSPLAPISPPPAPRLQLPTSTPAPAPRPLPSVLPLPPAALDSLLPFAGSGSQVVAFMGSPLDWLQRFVLSMGCAVLLYNVNVYATIGTAMYWLWWPLWRAAATNTALRSRYKHAGVWMASLLDVQVVQRGPLAKWRLLIGDDSGTTIEMLVGIPSPAPPLRRSDPVVLLVLSDRPSLHRFRAVREAWVPGHGCWMAEDGEERVERTVMEGMAARMPQLPLL
ncbi:hypothetical protein CLOM_g19658 [Closterium sp. NIES-68]|nr:hypothetical protein CLOM_g19658 [Closterium sp. NIES-68]GJP80521.1 hypothetical protein CLOP_g10727 [Closterium sp. NIES-67]